MASPVINSVSPAGPVTVPVGQATVVTVTGGDADNRTDTLRLRLVDPEGHESAIVSVPFSFTDGPLVLVADWLSGGSAGLTVNGLSVSVVG